MVSSGNKKPTTWSTVETVHTSFPVWPDRQPHMMGSLCLSGLFRHATGCSNGLGYFFIQLYLKIVPQIVVCEQLAVYSYVMDKQTQGEKKILVNFKKIVITDGFKEEVKRVRGALGIPLDGFVLTEEELKDVNRHIKTSDPEEYHFVAKGLHWECKSDYPRETEKLLLMFPVMNGYLSMLLRNYIYYNVFLYNELLEYSDHLVDVCMLADAEEESSMFLIDEDHEGSFSVEHHNKAIEGLIYKYPVSVRLHPHASQNDVIDFIKKNWKTIKKYQDKYQTKDTSFSLKNSKTKTNKNIRERDDFIYENRNLPRRDIMRIVNKKFGADLDQGSIGKIISLEKVKRSGV